MCGNLFTACSDWLEVRPKSQVLADVHFDSEEGYADQLTGVYSSLSTPELFGREMTFGFREALSQNYDLGPSNRYREDAQYNYGQDAVKTRITSIWAGMYNAIANLNIMLDYLETADRSIFSNDNYALYRGEALGLRAFLHFELLRMFAPAYTVSPAAEAIPYVTRYTTETTPFSSVQEVLTAVISDLEEASGYLEIDPLKVIEGNDAYSIRNSRASRFNYYAARATLARAYLWKGDLANAGKCAGEVIETLEEYRFSWVHYTTITSQYAYERDLIFSNEHIFRLNIRNLDEIVNPYFRAQDGGSVPVNKLSPSSEKMSSIYEVASSGLGMDYRYYYHFQYDGGSEQYLAKFWQYDNNNYGNRMPLIRISEMFYIAAEAVADSDPAAAAAYLNEVRNNRGLSNFPLSETLNSNEVKEEIYKEYRKELVGEGQLFYYYKRLNVTSIPGTSHTGSNAVYVLPVPENEKEFGNR